MMRLLKLFSAVFCTFLFSFSLAAAERPVVTVLNFNNVLRSQNSAHFSSIIADSISRDLEKQGLYDIDRINRRIPSTPRALKGMAGSRSADYVVTGSYVSRGQSIALECVIYTARNERLYKISIPSKRVGVFLNTVISSLTAKINNELKNYTSLAVPEITPEDSEFDYYQEVSITTGLEGATIYYTTNGTLPDSANGTAYEGPFKIYKKTKIRAVSATGNDFVSDEMVKTYTPLKSLYFFELKAFYGRMSVAEWEMDFDNTLSNGHVASLGAAFYLGGINSLKSNPVLRNVGVGPWFDFMSIQGENSQSLKMQGYSGALYYKMRFTRYFTLEVPVSYGFIKTRLVKTEGDFWDDMFSEAGADKIVDKSDDYYGSVGLFVNIPLGPFQLDFGCTYKQIFYDNMDDMQMLTYQGGVGFNF
jgi:TolB-like protein